MVLMFTRAGTDSQDGHRKSNMALGAAEEN